jgi:hypothetical protein
MSDEEHIPGSRPLHTHFDSQQPKADADLRTISDPIGLRDVLSLCLAELGPSFGRWPILTVNLAFG